MSFKDLANKVKKSVNDFKEKLQKIRADIYLYYKGITEHLATHPK